MELDEKFIEVLQENARAQQHVADKICTLIDKMDDYIEGRREQTSYIEKVIEHQNETLFLRVRNTVAVLMGVVTAIVTGIVTAVKFWKAGG